MTQMFPTDKDALAYLTQVLEDAIAKALVAAPLINNDMNRKLVEDAVARQITIFWDMNHYSKQFRDNLQFEVVRTPDPSVCSLQWRPLTLLGCDMLEAMCPDLKDQIDVARAELSKPIEFTIVVTDFQEGVDVKTAIENGDRNHMRLRPTRCRKASAKPRGEITPGNRSSGASDLLGRIYSTNF